VGVCVRLTRLGQKLATPEAIYGLNWNGGYSSVTSTKA
jgi:hypothetical protein